MENTFSKLNFGLLKGSSLDLLAVAEYLSAKELPVTKDSVSDGVLLAEFEGMMISVALVEAQIPGDEVERAMHASLLWRDAEQPPVYQSHALVYTSGATALQAQTINSMVCMALIATNDVAAIYNGDAVLLIEPEIYADMVTAAFPDDEQEAQYPLMLWVNFGFIPDDRGNSVITFGLKQFGLREIEILFTSYDNETLFNFIYDIVSYVVDNNVQLQDGETIGFSEEQKLAITVSPGTFIDGESIKIELVL
ncbi:DUF4261 domain-containing protein [Culicoidibacter larvae]|uniref:DUF4261 domain-containing protein n=1 Tax=Culicoidibacter larvae TaxID=2579976 RepID=A0A5R8QCS9_9FIRM|nr:DUF4261 domain-containing protein [Culicoidibacter larvae]TLG73783.1 DUF4261 domain-containing protein [Culicoidibacter larvae]